MEKKNMNIAMMGNTNISKCLYCGGKPIVTVKIQSNNFDSDKIIHQEVTCSYCGLSASIDVWETICDIVENPILEDDYEKEN